MERNEGSNERHYDWRRLGDRRLYERRSGIDRRGPLRWDPRRAERRSGTERRAAPM